MARTFHYKVAVGAVLAVLALAIVGGLFVLQFLTIQRAAQSADVHVEVVKEGVALFTGNLTVRDATALSALRAAATAGGFDVETREYPGQGTYVVRVGPYREEGGLGWLFCIGEPCEHPKLAADRFALKDGDRLRWHWGTAADGL